MVVSSLLTCGLAGGCADAPDALDAHDTHDTEDAPVLAQALDGGTGVTGVSRADAAVGSRDASTRDGATASPADAGEASGDEGVDMTGTWFARVSSEADITAPLVGAAPSEVDMALRLYVSETDDGLQADVAVCSLATKSGSLSLDFEKVQPFIKLSAPVPGFSASVGGAVPFPELVFQIGQDEAGAPVDMDGDGKPGATIPSVALGAVPFDAYVGMDLKIAMDATLKDAQTVVGTATFSGAGKVLGSTIPLVSSGAVGVKQTAIPTNFEAKRHEGDVPCAELLKK